MLFLYIKNKKRKGVVRGLYIDIYIPLEKNRRGILDYLVLGRSVGRYYFFMLFN